MEVECVCETSVAIYQTTRHRVQEDSYVHSNRCDKVT